MASNGIRDRVAIIGMGCTNFGEHWDKSADDMLIDASTAALADAGIALDDVDAVWLGTMGSGLSGLTLSRPLKIQHKPVTHVENYCATGSEAFRNACYAVASGAYDIAMAIGVEKLKDSGYSGLVVPSPANDGTGTTVTAPASFSLLAPAYAKKYGVDDQELKDVMTRIAWKNHRNGALNPRAQFRKEVPKETIACSPLVAGPLGIFDCSGVSDGSAAAIIVRAEDAHKYTDKPLYVKALSFVAGTTTAYLINRRWTFRAEPSRRRFLAVVVLYAVTFALQVGLFSVLFTALTRAGLGELTVQVIAFVIAQGVATTVNFVVQRAFIFRLR